MLSSVSGNPSLFLKIILIMKTVVLRRCQLLSSLACCIVHSTSGFSRIVEPMMPLPLHLSVDNDNINRSTTTPPPPFSIIATSPLSPNSFAGQVESALLSRFRQSTIERVLTSWRYLEAGYEHVEYVGDKQSPPVPLGMESTSKCYQYAPSYIPNLKVKTWWDDVVNENKMLWAKMLSKSYPAIKDEFESVVFAKADKLHAEGSNVWARALTSDAESYGPGWKTLVLLNRGRWDDANAKLFPVTSNAIHDSGIPAVEAFFASMDAHSSIEPHSDFTNFVLTCHLPLIVPENGSNKCRLTVGDETRQWTEGNLILFDTSIYHDATNEADATRYILMLRIWHPDLTKEECDALQFIYDCLEIPELLSEDTEIALGAQRLATSMKEFPLVQSRTTGGFGGSKGKVGDKKSSRRAKR